MSALNLKSQWTFPQSERHAKPGCVHGVGLQALVDYQLVFKDSTSAKTFRDVV